MKKEGIDEERDDSNRGCDCADYLSSNRLHDVISQRIIDLIVMVNAICKVADVAHFLVIAVNSPIEAKNL
jgi:hypothetical protein